MAIEMISPAGSFTVADLEQIEDDRHRYELCDGALVVTPAPGILHQRVLAQLIVFLYDRVEAGEVVLPGPGMYFSPTHYRIPDVVVVTNEVLDRKWVDVPPRIAVEILSPSTHTIDAEHKRTEYARFGILEYWIIDPIEATITALNLVDGTYIESDSPLAAEARMTIFG